MEVRCQYKLAIKTMAERELPDGFSLRIRNVCSERRSFLVDGNPERLSWFPPPPAAMSYWFIFCYGERYFQFVAFPFWWRQYPLSYTLLLLSFTTSLWRMVYLVLSYLDYFLISPSPLGFAATKACCKFATNAIARFMAWIGLLRNWKKATGKEVRI